MKVKKPWRVIFFFLIFNNAYTYFFSALPQSRYSSKAQALHSFINQPTIHSHPHNTATPGHGSALFSVRPSAPPPQRWPCRRLARQPRTASAVGSSAWRSLRWRPRSGAPLAWLSQPGSWKGDCCCAVAGWLNHLLVLAWLFFEHPGKPPMCAGEREREDL